MTFDEPPPEDEYLAMLDRLDNRLDEFVKSHYYEELPVYQQREARFVLENVGEFLASYMGVSIDAPDRHSLEIVCTRYYPAKVTADPEHFAVVAPVLVSFLRFLDDAGHIDDSETLASHVESLEDEIVTKAMDEDNWGMAKSMLMSDDEDVELHDLGDVDGPDGTHQLNLSEHIDALEPTDISPVPESQIDATAANDPLGGKPGSEFTAEEREAIVEAFDALSVESREIFDALEASMFDLPAGGDPIEVFEHTDVSPHEALAALDEVFAEAGIETETGMGDPDDPRVLDPEQATRFFEWYGRLLVYVNDRFDVLPAIDTYEEFTKLYRDETYPIRKQLYTGCDTAAVIQDFVEENPADLPEDALSQIASWEHAELGDFALVDHRETDSVLLDPDTPRAFAVTGLEFSLAEFVPEGSLPTPLDDIVLLPFEGSIVPDPWVRLDPISGLVWEGMGIDIPAAYEEAKHRFGIVESLPPGEERDRSDAEKLRFYTKNKENRERYADEIADLKDKTPKLARVYHEQLGKANARRLGREFRDMGLNEAYVAIYNGQVIASAPSEAQLQKTLSGVMPDGKADHPYVYHYHP